MSQNKTKQNLCIRAVLCTRNATFLGVLSFYQDFCFFTSCLSKKDGMRQRGLFWGNLDMETIWNLGKSTSAQRKFSFSLLFVILYNYPPKGRWVVVDIYRDAKRRGIYPPLFTDPEGDSCFSIYQIRWIKNAVLIFSSETFAKRRAIFLSVRKTVNSQG